MIKRSDAGKRSCTRCSEEAQPLVPQEARL